MTPYNAGTNHNQTLPSEKAIVVIRAFMLGEEVTAWATLTCWDYRQARPTAAVFEVNTWEDCHTQIGSPTRRLEEEYGFPVHVDPHGDIWASVITPLDLDTPGSVTEVDGILFRIITPGVYGCTVDGKPQPVQYLDMDHDGRLMADRDPGLGILTDARVHFQAEDDGLVLWGVPKNSLSQALSSEVTDQHFKASVLWQDTVHRLHCRLLSPKA